MRTRMPVACGNHHRYYTFCVLRDKQNVKNIDSNSSIQEENMLEKMKAVMIGFAGALYGYDSIPIEWRKKLIRLE